jgi:hypothetical protein
LEVPTVTTNGAEPVPPGRPRPSIEDLFQDGVPVRSADDLAREAVVDEGEVEEFLADLYAMRRADLA